MFIALVNNIALLLAMSICHSFILQTFRYKTFGYTVASGCLFGIVTIAGMMNPYVLTEGIIFDGRSLVASIAGLFGGPVAATLVVLFGGLYRWLGIGGDGVWMGIVVLIVSAAWGVLFHYLRNRNVVSFTYTNLYAFGVLVHVCMLLSMALLPSSYAWYAFTRISLPVMILFPLGTVILGKLLDDQEKFQQAYLALNENEERYRMLVENAPDGIFVQTDSTIVFANHSLVQMLGGSSQKEFVGRSVYDHFHPSFHSSVRERIQMLNEEKRMVGCLEEIMLDRSGNEVHVEISAVPVRYYGKGGAIVFVRNIEERKRSERLLAESEERFRAALSETPFPVILHNDKGEVQFINKVWEEITGYSKEEIPTVDAWISKAYGNRKGKIQEEIDKLYRLNKRIDEGEFRIQTKNGEIRTWEFSSAPLGEDKEGNRLVVSVAYDVTDKKEKEEILKTILEHIPIMIGYFDSKGNIVWVNKTWETILGYTLRDMRQNDDIMKEFYPDEEHRRNVLEFIKKSERTWDTFKTRVASGVVLDTMWMYIRLSDGTIIGFGLDITQQKRIEEELESNRKILLTAMDQSIAGIAIAEAPSGKIRYINKNGLIIVGKTKDEIEHGIDLYQYIECWNISGLNREQPRKDEHPLMRAIRYGETSSNEFMIRQANGTETYVIANAAPILDHEGKPTAAIVVYMDVTDVKYAETHQRKLLTAIEQSSDIVVITDTEGAIQYVNSSFETITGYAKEEVIGQTMRILKSGEHDETFYKTLWETIGSGRVWSGQLINKKKDGSLYYENANISPVLDESGHIINYVAVKRDITKERELESQLRQSQKMESVGRLAGGVAHDFNNILTAIIGYTNFALSKIRPEHEIHDDLLQVKAASERAANLTRQLLAFSRKQILQPKIIELNQLILDLDKMVRRLIGEDIEYVTIPSDGLWKVKADPSQLEQVIINLVVNARDAMPAGGKLIIETKNITLDEGYIRTHADTQPGDYVMIAVSDTGTGINENIREKIFEPFFTTKEREKGTGLGLSTVHGIVKQSGGSIFVYSELGQGTTFKIYLPRVYQECDSPLEPLEITIPYSGKETILLVEDNDMVRSLVKQALILSGYNVLTASYGSQAIELVERYREPIHLLITDVVMPRMSGKELAEILAAKYGFLKILYMSGYTDNAIVHHGMLDQGINFLQKPFSPQLLLQTVRRLLDL